MAELLGVLAQCKGIDTLLLFRADSEVQEGRAGFPSRRSSMTSLSDLRWLCNGNWYDHGTSTGFELPVNFGALDSPRAHQNYISYLFFVWGGRREGIGQARSAHPRFKEHTVTAQGDALGHRRPHRLHKGARGGEKEAGWAVGGLLGAGRGPQGVRNHVGVADLDC